MKILMKIVRQKQAVFLEVILFPFLKKKIVKSINIESLKLVVKNYPKYL